MARTANGLTRLPNSDTIALDQKSPLQLEREQAAMIEHDAPYGVGSGHMGDPLQDDTDEANEALGRNDDTTWLMPDSIRFPTAPPYMEDATPPEEVDQYEHYFDMVPDSRPHAAQNVIVQQEIPLQDAPWGWLRNVDGEMIPITSVVKLRLSGGRVIACRAEKEEVLAHYPDDVVAANEAMNTVAAQISAALGITVYETVEEPNEQE